MRNRPVPLALVIVVWVIVLGSLAVSVWFLFGLSAVFRWNDSADRVQLSLFAAGGVGAVAALVVSYRKQRLAEESAVLDKESHFGQRFIAATEQLGSANRTVRMAGAYSLVHLADDWVQQRQMIVDVLTAYVRSSSLSATPPNELDEVAAAILRAIRDRLQTDVEVVWQGCKFDFSESIVPAFPFDGVVLISGTAVTFRNSVFNGVTSVFNGKFAAGSIDFEGARFNDSRVRLGGRFEGGLNFRDVSASFSTIDISEATILGDSIAFEAASLEASSLLFSGATIAVNKVNFVGLKVADSSRFFFDHVDVSAAELTFIAAQLGGALISFEGTIFSVDEVLFCGTIFKSQLVEFASSRFVGATVNLDGVRVRNALVSFEGADIAGISNLSTNDFWSVVDSLHWGNLTPAQGSVSEFPDRESMFEAEIAEENYLQSFFESD